MKILKVMRAIYELKQEDLAREVGRSRPWLSLVENGKLEPQREQAERLTKLLESLSGERTLISNSDLFRTTSNNLRKLSVRCQEGKDKH